MLTIPGKKEMQIKTLLRFYLTPLRIATILTPLRIATIKNTNNNKYWGGCREKGTLIHCW
jgi:hypothetical protein